MLTVCACVCVCFLPDSQGSAELNPLKCPPGFCPHVSAEFPRIHPTIQTLCVRALWNALGLTGAWTVCVCVHVCKWAYNIKKGKFFFSFPFSFLHLFLRRWLGNTQSPHLLHTRARARSTFHLSTHTHSTPTHTSSHMCSHSKRALHPLTLTPTHHPHTHVHCQIAHSLPSHSIPSTPTHPPTTITTTEHTHVFYTHKHTHAHTHTVLGMRLIWFPLLLCKRPAVIK